MTQVPSDAAWHVFGQLMAAFGHGAGGVHVTTDAAAAAAAAYALPIEQRVAEWPSIEADTLAFARALGQLCAHHALDDGRAHVTGADLQWAARTIRPLLPCPMCAEARLSRSD